MASQGWRFLAFTLNGDGTETLLASDLPLEDVSFDAPLSGVPSMSASISTEVTRLVEGGSSVLVPWSTAIYAEEDNTIRGGWIISGASERGPNLSLTGVGFTGYLAGIPYEGEASYVSADALDVLRDIWENAQAQPGGNIGLRVDPDMAGVLLGRQDPDTAPLHLEGSKMGALLPKGTRFRYQWTKTPAVVAKTVKKTDKVTKKVTVTKTPAKPAVVETYFGQATRTYSKPPAGGFVVLRETKTGKVTRQLTGTTLPAGHDVVGTIVKTAPKKDTDTGEELQPFTLQWFADSDLQPKVDSITQLGAFDWWEEHTWAPGGLSVQHFLRFAVPTAGRVREDLRFVVGENLLEEPDLQQRGEDFASEVVVLGAGEGRDMVRGTWKLSNNPRIRRVKTVSDKSIRTKAAANALAQRVGLAANGGDNITQIVVWDHPNAPIGSWQLGDTVLVQGNGIGWSGQWQISVRILATQTTPESDRATLTVTRAERAAQ